MKTPLFFLLMLLFVMPAMAQTTLFEDDFEMANFKPQWTPIPGVPNGIVDIANGWGFDDSRGARLGKSSSAGGYVSNALDLHLNLAGQTQVAMTFKIGDVADETDYDDAIFFSNDGGINFERVFVFEPSDWCDQYGQFPPLDIDQLAVQNGLTLTSQFVIRFQQHGEDYLPYYDGFYLDDVRVYVPDLTYAPLPFTDTFETGAFGSMWTWSFSDQTNSLADIPTRPSNLVDIATNWGFDNSRGVRMGKTCSDGPATNALDLHLNLAGQTQVAMTFKIGDVADETDYDDAIFFSNNGGLNFERVFVFEPSDWCDQYGQFPPLDIDQLAAQNGLTLTSQFVIRFQQHGEDYLPYYDGFYLDDVRVYVPDLTYAPLPFTDTFETGAFGSMWTWSFADQTNSLADIPTRPSNLVDIATAIGFNSSRGVRMGKTCSDGPATNALDLHLNLAGQTQVAMTFKIRDVADETDYDDAIYFSNNGGITFVKVYSFVWGATADVYTDYNLNISNLAATNGLALTNQFVIRFQQYGEDYLPYYDGIYLDNVQVTGTSTGIESTATNPAQDLLLVYPNPAGSWLHLNTAIPHLQEGSLIQIFSATGQLALQHNIGVAGGGNPVAIDHLAPGLYFVQLTTPQGNYCQRIVKQ